MILQSKYWKTFSKSQKSNLQLIDQYHERAPSILDWLQEVFKTHLMPYFCTYGPKFIFNKNFAVCSIYANADIGDITYYMIVSIIDSAKKVTFNSNLQKFLQMILQSKLWKEYLNSKKVTYNQRTTIMKGPTHLYDNEYASIIDIYFYESFL